MLAGASAQSRGRWGDFDVDEGPVVEDPNWVWWRSTKLGDFDTFLRDLHLRKTNSSPLKMGETPSKKEIPNLEN